MAEQRQTIVTPPPAGSKAGSRKETTLRSCFASSPIHSGEMTDDERRKLYNQEALEGTVSGGNGLNSFDRDFTEAPDLEDVDTEGLNIPSPYMPNPTSPGPGSINASDKPAFTGDVMDPDLNVEFGSGLGGLLSPANSAKEISKQDTLGSYISGKSYAGSDGGS